MRLRRRHRHVFERVALPFQVYCWFSPVTIHTNDYIRAEDWYMNRLGYEDFLPGQARDWNEEIQSSREMPRKTLLERLMRTRALSKIYGDFVTAATRGAINVINNNVVSINPSEEPKLVVVDFANSGVGFRMRMFLWNNIFFSLGFDIRDHYKTLGGDAAAFVSPLCDLHGVQAYFNADPESLSMLATTVVEYKGYRITCQSVIPGKGIVFAPVRCILDKDQDQEQCILYGSVDFGCNVFMSDRFNQLVLKTFSCLHSPNRLCFSWTPWPLKCTFCLTSPSTLRPFWFACFVEVLFEFRVKSEKGNVVLVKTAAESKGIIGNDSRCYILDLYRHYPSDPHYIENATVSEFAKSCGFPRKHPHVLAYLRPELIESFIHCKLSAKSRAFIELIGRHFNKFRELLTGETDKTSWIFFSQRKSGVITMADLLNCFELTQREVTVTKEKSSNQVDGETDSKDSTSDEKKQAAEDENDGRLEETKSNFLPCNLFLLLQSDPSMEPFIAAVDKENFPFKLFRKGDQQQDIVDTGEVMLDCCKKNFNMKGRKALDVVDTDAVADGTSSDSRDATRVRNAFRCSAIEMGSCKDYGCLHAEVFCLASKLILQVSEFDLRFNIDCYSPVVKHASEEGEFERQKALHVELADFLLTSQIPKFVLVYILLCFVEDCAEHTLPPFDSHTVTEILHSRGIGMRYLGFVANKLSEKSTLQYWQKHCLSAIIVRCAKHSFRCYLQSVGAASTATAIAHFLNCFLTSEVVSIFTNSDDAAAKRKSKKRNKASHADHRLPPESTEWAKVSSKSLWQEICKDAQSYYAYNFKELVFAGNFALSATVRKVDSITDFCEARKVPKFALLRSLCIAVGIQVKLRDYDLSVRCKAPFTADDIMNMNPLVRRLQFEAKDGASSYEAAVAKLEAGQLSLGLELLNEAAQLYGNVHGSVHPEIIKCLRLTARVSYVMNDYTGALLNQHKAVVMTERCYGIDSAYLISDYLCMAIFSFANGKIPTALKLLYRSRYLVLMLNGEDHPEMALIDVNFVTSNIGLMLYAVGELDFSMQFLRNALAVNLRYFGNEHLKTALSYDLLARTYACRNDFRSALLNEKQTFFIYKKLLGENNERTKASQQYLQQLTEQAVRLQRRMNSMRQNNSSAVARFCAVEVRYPEAIAVIEVLTVINGMYWVFSK
ncbi:protein KIAA0664 [Trichuris trichiura]|uniref:Protein KIAA0664 n=1 Tax=Trichuris trichiura TaxID=36087 RepID=A0A077ZMX6_TRITR|nr:protein KIAA0664 [Trichuris trichiura]